MKKTALDVILDEHRALESVLTALRDYIDGVVCGKYSLDGKVLAAMIEFVTQYPNQIHHRKEHDHLFRRVRNVAPDCAEILDRLEAQHAELPDRQARLEHGLIHLVNVGETALEGFRSDVHDYVDFLWAHFLAEEQNLLPQLQVRLSAAQWAQIDADFLADQGLWNNTSQEFRALFDKIVAMVPDPLGLG